MAPARALQCVRKFGSCFRYILEQFLLLRESCGWANRKHSAGSEEPVNCQFLTVSGRARSWPVEGPCSKVRMLVIWWPGIQNAHNSCDQVMGLERKVSVFLPPSFFFFCFFPYRVSVSTLAGHNCLTFKFLQLIWGLWGTAFLQVRMGSR